MNAFRFLAKDAADAVSQIRARLGPEAVVVSVNPVPGPGVGRLWRKPQLEVVAALPDTAAPPEPAAEPAAPLAPPNAVPPRIESAARPTRLDCLVGDAVPLPVAAPSPVPAPFPAPAGSAAAAFAFRPRDGESPAGPPPPAGLGGAWRSADVLYQMGLLPLYVEQILERARAHHGDAPPAVFAQELAAVRTALTSFWRPLPPEPAQGPALHVFVGPPGSGKTTVLCKWLTKSVLGSGRKSRVWRLDGRTANFPGLLDFYGEILGVAVEREWAGQGVGDELDLGFIDLPGVSIQDNSGLEALRKTVASLPRAQVHLVLNAAYEVTVLLAQARAFSALPISDLIFAHLDEEKRRGKLWNLVLGTNFAVRFLSGGQNIPGDFQTARPERLLSK